MNLTPREYEVLQLLANGAIQKHLPELLGIGASTVEHHLKQARKRLNSATTYHAIAQALRLGLIK